MSTKKARNRKRKRTMLRNRCIMICLISAMLIAGIFGVLNAKAQGDQGKTSASKRYYKSIEIEYGDSLWSIAERYKTDEYDSIQDYIDELIEINQLTSDELYETRYLTVIYTE